MSVLNEASRSEGSGKSRGIDSSHPHLDIRLSRVVKFHVPVCFTPVYELPVATR